ncbi:unnamed protein product [Medioppia subpectinata]|uniref:Uncharacterized protein n=1 Tax=Medioppia subpectinata TaxID=1979941 RepID=A0A7R9Q056_9ACAR|nr:unnamed protein product [Medioppia subpectinata]CAG2107735.1 unnamed protein product [Medioppia subpectinata]
MAVGLKCPKLKSLCFSCRYNSPLRCICRNNQQMYPFLSCLLFRMISEIFATVLIDIHNGIVTSIIMIQTRPDNSPLDSPEGNTHNRLDSTHNSTHNSTHVHLHYQQLIHSRLHYWRVERTQRVYNQVLRETMRCRGLDTIEKHPQDSHGYSHHNRSDNTWHSIGHNRHTRRHNSHHYSTYDMSADHNSDSNDVHLLYQQPIHSRLHYCRVERTQRVLYSQNIPEAVVVFVSTNRCSPVDPFHRCLARHNLRLPMSHSMIDSKYSKDSFDRFGDDLCEELLSFLTFEDRFRYECISRQWHRLTRRHDKNTLFC